MTRDTTFEEARPLLFGIAYRLLGSRAEAEDAVQDTFLRWHAADRGAVENARAWLTSVCTRHCIDLMRAADRSRVDYVGAWLPEPVHAAEATSPEDVAALDSSLSVAFLMLLRRLAPKERAAYLLHDVFELDYREIAAALGIREPACRKLVSRARASVASGRYAQAPARERQEELLRAFQQAVSEGVTDRLKQLLAEDVELRADGGGKVAAAEAPVLGRDAVLGFVGGALREYWSAYRWEMTELNGTVAAMLWLGDQLAATVSFGWDEERRARAVYIVRNPDKLAALG
ncbi:RNA polymerase sigma factor SigJ [Anaeromyxobacter sp. Red801]|uniref:RNA polymerase sigma factor SigJ n=1 Tax=Anaeromyxobacter sp. Red801 TaxID=3411632 RepID=UPI003BA3C80D